MYIFLICIFFTIMATVWFFFKKKIIDEKFKITLDKAEEILKQALNESETKKKEIVIEGKSEVFKLKQDAENEISKQKKEILEQEKYVRKREEIYDKKIENIENETKTLEKKINKVNENLCEIERIKSKQIRELERISNMSSESAKEYVIKLLEENLEHEKGAKILEYEQILNGEKQDIAKNILSLAIQRISTEHVTKSSVSVILLPNDDMKGRIIGREGRNIRAIETLLNVDLIIDDTPETITISSFDPIRREVAKRALEALIDDGRIHPARIEEEVIKAQEEVKTDIFLTGQKTVTKLRLRGVSSEIIEFLGRLKYRTSYSQNVLEHSIEVAHICEIIASELGIKNTALAKRCGLLHDIGKALTHESEGSHIELGVEIAKKNKESQEVIDSIAFHHSNVSNVNNFFILITQAADSISAARPGARKENIESYVKRIQKLEELVSEFPGVEKCFAIQAGREVRIMINPEKVSDEALANLAREVSKKIESELTYPGQIKLNLIRESRVVEFAK